MKRFTPLKPRPFNDDGSRRYSTLKRSRMKRKPPKRVERRRGAAPYLAFIRSLCCISCGSRKRSDAAHMPVGPRGAGLKSPDRNTVPLCRACHRWFDGHTNPVLPREERRALAVKWLEQVREMVTPGDDRDSARDLEALGLGHVEDLGDGRWRWAPGGGSDNERKDAA